jgi:polyphosphate kinase
MYTASADWMTRNLDKRVELCLPIYSPDIYQELRKIIDIQLADNVKARWIDEDQSNEYKLAKGLEERVRAQIATYYFLAQKS